ncbi:MAG TPA: hypothetical protein VG408_09975, partial [Actinomycetota bacterium]|nr:hypothetical protein [Actinomycetota bacterium]
APSLGATNLFSSDHSSFVDVRMPRGARWTWDPFESRSLSIKGDGRVAGFMLLNRDTNQPRGFLGVSFRVCDEPGCTKGWSGRVTTMVIPIGLKWPEKGMTFDMPPGRYRAYVIADGAPVDVRLELEDVRGTAEMTPSHRVDSSVGVDAAPEPIKNLFTAGSTFTLKSRGLSVQAFVERHELGTVHLYTECLYEGAPELPEEIAFTPACQAAGASMVFGGGGTIPPLVTSGASGSYSIKPNLMPGTYSFGGTYAGVQEVKDAAFLSVWVSYE